MEREKKTRREQMLVELHSTAIETITRFVFFRERKGEITYLIKIQRLKTGSRSAVGGGRWTISEWLCASERERERERVGRVEQRVQYAESER
jgi:hypothetical protein